MYNCFASQTPTSKQSRYKEQVAEIRKGRNSGLQKEQKEKHMVRHHHFNMLLFTSHFTATSTACAHYTSLCLNHRSIGRHTATPENLSWRTSPVNTIWSFSGKPRPEHLKTW